MNWLTKLAQVILRWRARRQWKDLTDHIASCPRRKCAWWREHEIPEDQDASLFCYQGGRIWERNWDMSYHAEVLP